MFSSKVLNLKILTDFLLGKKYSVFLESLAVQSTWSIFDGGQRAENGRLFGKAYQSGDWSKSGQLTNNVATFSRRPMSTLGKTVNDGYEEWLGQIDAIGGELAWIRKSKSFPKKPVGNERSWTEINDSVLKSQPVQDAIAAEAERRRCSKKEVYLEAKEIVSNMAQEFSLPAVKVIGYGVVKVIKKLFDAIYVNLDQLRSLKAKVATNSVVLMPTHKTYVDFLLLSLLCYHEDVTLPAIAAGSDFQQSKIMGEALRRCGAFFMRRSFGKDQLYWAIFSEYVQTHIVHNDRPVEFFIEGTRSRNTKSLHPKHGLLQIILEPYLKGQVYDVVIVPVTMNYDKILEESLYAYELLGFQKPKETTSGLLKARHILDQSFGNVYVTFSEPISIRNYLEPKVDRHSLAFLPNRQFALDSNTKNVIRKFGHEIIQIHNSNNVVTLWPVFCLALTSLLDRNPFSKPSTLKYSEIVQKTAEIVELCRRLSIQIQIHKNFDDDLRRNLNLHLDLFEIFDSNQEDFDLTLAEMPIEKDSSVPRPLLQKAVTEIILANHVNQFIGFLAEIGYICASLSASNSENVPLNQLEQDFQFLQELFVREFIFVPGQTFDRFYSALTRLETAKVVRIHENVVEIQDSEAVKQLNNFLMPFVRSYSLTLNTIRSFGPRLHLFSSKTVIPKIQQEIAKMIEDDPKNAISLRLSFLSKEIINNAFHFATHNQLVHVKAWNSLELDSDKMNSFLNRLTRFDVMVADAVPTPTIRSRI